MISKFTRHLGPKCRGDHSPRIRFPILVACCTSPRMEILSVPRLVAFGCSYPFTQDIGPGLSFYAIGAQGKIGPHTLDHPKQTCLYIYIYIYNDRYACYPKKINDRHATKCNSLIFYFFFSVFLMYLLIMF